KRFYYLLNLQNLHFGRTYAMGKDISVMKYGNAIGLWCFAKDLQIFNKGTVNTFTTHQFTFKVQFYILNFIVVLELLLLKVTGIFIGCMLYNKSAELPFLKVYGLFFVMVTYQHAPKAVIY